jgi:hypothetical protein
VWCGIPVRDGFGVFYHRRMRTYHTVISLKDVSGNVPRATTDWLSEIMGFLKPKRGDPSAIEESFVERERERQREKQ